jgi:hypothetical protein
MIASDDYSKALRRWKPTVMPYCIANLEEEVDAIMSM